MSFNKYSLASCLLISAITCLAALAQDRPYISKFNEKDFYDSDKACEVYRYVKVNHKQLIIDPIVNHWFINGTLLAGAFFGNRMIASAIKSQYGTSGRMIIRQIEEIINDAIEKSLSKEVAHQAYREPAKKISELSAETLSKTLYSKNTLAQIEERLKLKFGSKAARNIVKALFSNEKAFTQALQKELAASTDLVGENMLVNLIQKVSTGTNVQKLKGRSGRKILAPLLKQMLVFGKGSVHSARYCAGRAVSGAAKAIFIGELLVPAALALQDIIFDSEASHIVAQAGTEFLIAPSAAYAATQDDRFAEDPTRMFTETSDDRSACRFITRYPLIREQVMQMGLEFHQLSQVLQESPEQLICQSPSFDDEAPAHKSPASGDTPPVNESKNHDGSNSLVRALE